MLFGTITKIMAALFTVMMIRASSLIVVGTTGHPVVPTGTSDFFLTVMTGHVVVVDKTGNSVVAMKASCAAMILRASMKVVMFGMSLLVLMDRKGMTNRTFTLRTDRR